MKDIVLVLLTVVSIIVSLILVPVFIARSKIRDKYCWLNLLNENTWKSSIGMANEAETVIKAKFLGSIIHGDLDELENEGLIISRETPSGSFLFEYKLTKEGFAKKQNMDQTMRAFAVRENRN